MAIDIGTPTVPPAQLARRARLRYVLDDEPGYSRRRNGRGFVYVNGRGNTIRDERVINRLEQLAIPPAWSEVWICRHSAGHLQTTGRDDRGRKQYIYHERWRTFATLENYRRLAQFGRVLPRLRRTVASALRGRGLTRTRVFAGLVALLDDTSIRVGGEEYVRQNNSYGLTTLRKRHVSVRARRAELRFRSKGGSLHRAQIERPSLVRLLGECLKLTGEPLFRYRDAAGDLRSATAADVNQFLQETTRGPFTAKDFRTWKASSVVAGVLYAQQDVAKPRQRNQVVREALALAAESLGNTPTVCRKH